VHERERERERERETTSLGSCVQSALMTKLANPKQDRCCAAIRRLRCLVFLGDFKILVGCQVYILTGAQSSSVTMLTGQG